MSIEDCSRIVSNFANIIKNGSKHPFGGAIFILKIKYDMFGVYDSKIPLLHVELQYDSSNPELFWNVCF